MRISIPHIESFSDEEKSADLRRILGVLYFFSFKTVNNILASYTFSSWQILQVGQITIPTPFYLVRLYQRTEKLKSNTILASEILVMFIVISWKTVFLADSDPSSFFLLEDGLTSCNQEVISTSYWGLSRRRGINSLHPWWHWGLPTSRLLVM